MLIFPKPFKVPASYLVQTYPRALAFVIYRKHVPGAGSGVGPEVRINDDANVKVLGVFFSVLLRCTSIMLVYLVS